jgi:hypothetical protein
MTRDHATSESDGNACPPHARIRCAYISIYIYKHACMHEPVAAEEPPGLDSGVRIYDHLMNNDSWKGEEMHVSLSRLSLPLPSTTNHSATTRKGDGWEAPSCQEAPGPICTLLQGTAAITTPPLSLSLSLSHSHSHSLHSRLEPTAFIPSSRDCWR